MDLLNATTGVTRVPPERPAILIAEDDPDSLDVLARFVQKENRVTLVPNGKQALAAMRAQPFDLVLLDMMMPELDGFGVLEELRREPTLRGVPVIVISAMAAMDGVARCIQLGAEDFLLKPFNAVLLKARIAAALEKKRLRDAERDILARLQEERQRSEQLLLSIFPEAVAERLKQGGSREIVEHFPGVTVLFADIHDFSRISAGEPPAEILKLLNRFFSTFDRLAEQHGVEKIKTIGDAYMAVAGLPVPRPDHAEAVAELALAMQGAAARIEVGRREPFSLRIGVSSGPVVAGVIGTSKLAYDLWGETVNTASHMESLGLPGAIQVSAATHRLLEGKYLFEERGAFYVKGVGELETYLMTGKAHRGG
jgi:adenylate cyclase